MTDAMLDILKAWIQTACPTVNEVIRRKQLEAGAPRPASPYAAVEFVADVAQGGTPYDHPSKEDGEEAGTKVVYHSWPRQATLQLDLYGETAADLAEILEISPAHHTVIEQLKAAGVTIQYVGGLGDTSALRDTSWEPSVQLEFWVTRVQSTTEEIEWIETAEYEITHKTAEAP